MKEFIKCLKNYAVFEGRARRREYWMFYLFTLIIGIFIVSLESLIGIKKFGEYGILSMIFGLIMTIPHLAVFIRRLHDVNKSGWMAFIALIPIIGSIWLLILALTKGTIGDNQYGPDPKAFIPLDSNFTPIQ